MGDGVRLWEVEAGDSLTELALTKMDREERIEGWISQNISVLAPDDSKLLVIGRQVLTDFGKKIDLLCMESNGDLVIVELKRDKTAREVTAQALDYASWVQGLDADRVEKIAVGYLKQELREACEKAFDEYPEIINERHSIRIVASEVDDSTERIIRYLSKNGIRINFVRFHLFGATEGKQFLVRTFTVAPAESEQNAIASATNRRTIKKTLETRLAECTNGDVRTFLGHRLADKEQRKDKGLIALLYPARGKIRFRARARKTYLRINQKGRFLNDEKYWQQNLSNHQTKTRDSGTGLAFNLHTQQDLDFFQNAMDKTLPDLKWVLEHGKQSEEPDEDDED